ncbi:MAG TPA: hypothetical protein VF432_16285 [Thermoanaerobaculia bacterium]
MFLAALACHDSENFSPTAPPFQNALIVTAGGATIPADGFSTVVIEAIISPAADASHRILEFTTSEGSFVEAAAATPKAVERTVDVNGKAIVHLKSSQQVGPVSVTVRVKDLPTIAKTVDVAFAPADPSGILKISAERATAPADGFTSTAIFADVGAGVPAGQRTVTFKATRGTFLTTGNGEATATADQSGRARVDLISPQAPVTARVSATVANVTQETSVEFVMAVPTAIAVEPEKLRIKATNDADGSTTLTVTMTRPVGSVSTGLTPRFAAFDANTGAALPFLFRSIERTNADGVAHAVMTAGPTTFRGVARIEVRVDGSAAVGMANVEVIDP